MTQRGVNQGSIKELDNTLKGLDIPEERIPQVITDIIQLTELVFPLKDIKFENGVLHLADDTGAVTLTIRSGIGKVLRKKTSLKVVKKQAA